jgi:hypothetical protein
MSLLQNEDFKTEAQITGAGGTASQLLNDTKIWVSGNSINKTLDDAIIDGDIGSGGSGINYIGNNEFKTNDTGWVEYEDAVSAVPVDGTGGTPESVFSRSTSSPLRGAASGLFAKPASNEQGEGVAYAFTIDAADQGKVQQISFDYTVTSPYVDGYLRVYIFDVTNSILIEPSQRDILANSGQAKYLSYWQAPSNSTSYRLLIHVADSASIAWNFKLDNVLVGPISQGNAGTFVSDWAEYTPTSQGFGTLANINLLKRRVGSSLEITGRFQVGTTTAVQARLGLDGLVASSSFTSGGRVVGKWWRNTATGSTRKTGTLVVDAGNNYLNFGNDDYTTAVSVTSGIQGSTVAATSEFLYIGASIPIQGWSTGVSASEISTSSVVAFNANKTSSQTVSATTSTTVTFSTVLDTSGGLSSGTYTIPESGVYSISAVIGLLGVTAGDDFDLELIKNTSTVIQTVRSEVVSADGFSSSLNYVGSFNKGDTINVAVNSGADSSYTVFGDASSFRTTFSGFKINSPAIIPPTEFVGCSYTTVTGSSCNNTEILVCDVKQYDSHNAYNTSNGQYVIPVSAKYRIQASIRTASVVGSLASFFRINIYKNTVSTIGGGGNFDYVENTSSRAYYSYATMDIDLVKGDVITIVVQENITNALNVSTSDGTKFMISKIG